MAAGENAPALLAGVARVDVTPPAGIQLFGYHRAAPMAGVHDPLYATALVLVAGADGEPLVLVALDHVGMGVATTRALRSAAARAAGTAPERVAICYSHTHSGPDGERLDWYGRERPPDAVERVYGATLPHQVASAVTLARRRLVPALAGAGTAECHLGMNRRVRGPDGRASHGVNPAGPVDRQVAALRVEAVDGRPLAAVVHYGVHGVVFRAEHLDCSADVTGAARQVVEAATGAPCLLVQGAAGDVNPRWRGDDAALRRCGWELGGAALRALAAAEPGPAVALGAVAETLSLHLKRLPDEAAAAQLAAEVARIWGAPTDAWLRIVRGHLARGERELTLPVEVQALRAGSFVRAGLPMEPFAALSLAFRERLAADGATSGPPPVTAFGGYTNGLAGYLPDAEAHAAGGYEIEWMPVVYGFYEGLLMTPAPHTASQIVDCAVRLCQRLLGSAPATSPPGSPGASG